MIVGPVCAICIDDILPTEQAKTTDCNHTFHENCIDPWLKHKNICVYCNTEDPFKERRVEVLGNSINSPRAENFNLVKETVIQIFTPDIHGPLALIRSVRSRIRDGVPITLNGESILRVLVPNIALMEESRLTNICKRELLELLQFILKQGGNPLEGPTEDTAIHGAVNNKSVQTNGLKLINVGLVQLLSNYTPVVYKDKLQKISRVFHTIMFIEGPFRDNDLEVIKALISHGFNQASLDWQRCTIFERANTCRNDHSIASQKVMQLLRLGRPLTFFEKYF